MSSWGELGWRRPLLVVAVLLLQRLPILLALKPVAPALRDWRAAAFLGWFGPIGTTALFYACAAAQQSGDRPIWTIASLLILASTFAHGLAAVPLTRVYGKAAA